ncbi:hypothetical protein SAMN04488078_10824 [Antarctobacter heliothermus]|uniref:Uncharacterized protein n=1 Tax=Antarctobacter heliothermus TaxID=74033 RepID=A0A239L706_9RHOB|nr:hypothetical protein SAMN04488078_10824 [Antarctobacter heliothermus]
MRGRLVLNGSIEIRSSFGENSGDHVFEAPVRWLLTVAPQTAGDTAEIQGSFKGKDGDCTAVNSAFCCAKIGQGARAYVGNTASQTLDQALETRS